MTKLLQVCYERNFVTKIAFILIEYRNDTIELFYLNIIQKQLGAFSNGLGFPDFGYGITKTTCFCFNFYLNLACPVKDPQLPAASEAAHWENFQRVAVDLIRKQPTPWSDETEKIVAFLLGVVSHSTADILWHDLAEIQNTAQGFIQATANANYK